MVFGGVKLNRKRVLITGITGQDGSILADLCLSKGHEVYGLVRRSSSSTYERIKHIVDKIGIFLGDITDMKSLINILSTCKPHYIFHMAAQSYVSASFESPQSTFDITGKGTLCLLDAVRSLQMEDNVKIYNATSSEMFGNVLEMPQTEKTPFNPCSPYGCAKVFSYNIASVYRKSYGMYICNGILFNHESNRRGEQFVTQKIAKAAALISQGKQKRLELGNIDAQRDWGWAEDYMHAAYDMLDQDIPNDFVIATGETHTVEEFVATAFDHVNLDWSKYVSTCQNRHIRPYEVDILLGDATKAHQILGWQPKVRFKEIVTKMVDYWLNRG